MKTLFYKGIALVALFVAVSFVASAQEKVSTLDFSNQQVQKRTIVKPDKAVLQQKKLTKIKHTQPISFDKNAVYRKEVLPKK